METTMRAKLKVISAQVLGENSEQVKFMAVCPNASYPADGSDENNSYARWTPTANLDMIINNPNLVGKFKSGDTFYVDFTPVTNE